MKVIFLDIDGVLNAENPSSKSRCGEYAGIDTDKLKRLGQIISETAAQIVLISSWKRGWHKPLSPFVNVPGVPKHVRYLNNKLQKILKISCLDKTTELKPSSRGLGIQAWLFSHPEVTHWVVLDDEIFEDYERCNILPHLIQTNFHYGLSEQNVLNAIKQLQKGE